MDHHETSIQIPLSICDMFLGSLLREEFSVLTDHSHFFAQDSWVVTPKKGCQFCHSYLPANLCNSMLFRKNYLLPISLSESHLSSIVILLTASTEDNCSYPKLVCWSQLVEPQVLLLFLYFYLCPFSLTGTHMQIKLYMQ